MVSHIRGLSLRFRFMPPDSVKCSEQTGPRAAPVPAPRLAALLCARTWVCPVVLRGAPPRASGWLRLLCERGPGNVA